MRIPLLRFFQVEKRLKVEILTSRDVYNTDRTFRLTEVKSDKEALPNKVLRSFTHVITLPVTHI